MARLKTLKPRIAVQADRLAMSPTGSWRSGKNSSTQRGYGYKWQKARLVHLAQHPLCEYCEREGRVTAAGVVDHRTPHRGDMSLFWDRSNWSSLCATCHSSTKQREEAES